VFMDFVQLLENKTFRKLDLFPSSGERRETAILLGPLGPVIEVSFSLTDSTEWVSPCPYLKTETDPVSEKLYFLVI
jgi:hypothetical protein